MARSRRPNKRSSDRAETRPRGEAAKRLPSGLPKALPKKVLGGRRGPQTAEDLADRQRTISVSEFFAKNRHLLGFDNPTKALMTTIKEAVDNALDACEEAHILPEIEVTVRSTHEENRFIVVVTDNGPGIVKEQIPRIFGKLLYGSKFHRLKMSRGQQGIGISAAGMYGMLTTGQPVKVWSCTRDNGKGAYYFEIQIDTSKNEPMYKSQPAPDWENGRGTRAQIELIGRLIGGRQSVREYIEQTAVSNPHAQIRLKMPGQPEVLFKRGTDQLPPETREIKPHPRGVELGVLMKMLKDTSCRTLQQFLYTDFSRVSNPVARAICKTAGLDNRARPASVVHGEAETLYKAIQLTKFMNPPTDCLAPIGEALILAGLTKEIDAEFYTAVTRPPAVYRGNPFQIEVGLAYGKGKEKEQEADEYQDQNAKKDQGEPVRLLRYANRVPLLYKQGDCALFKGVRDLSWRKYGLPHPRGGLPQGPVALMIHMASVWVPFTSESKEAVASYDEIRKEIRLALLEVGRRLNSFLKKRRNKASEQKRRDMFGLYIEEVVACCARLIRVNQKSLKARLTAIARKRTLAADQAAGNVPDDEEIISNGATIIVNGDGDRNLNLVLGGSPDAEDKADKADKPGRVTSAPASKLAAAKMKEKEKEKEKAKKPKKTATAKATEKRTRKTSARRPLAKAKQGSRR